MEKEMKMMRRENKADGFGKMTKGVLAILAVVMGIGGSMLISLLFGKQLKAVFPNPYVLEFVMEFISAVLGLALIFVYRKQKALGFSVKGMQEGMICGMALIAIPILAVLGVWFDMKNMQDLQWIQGWEMILLFLQCVLIGLFEEIIFRGIVLELSFEMFGSDTKKQAKRAIAFSAIVFGAIHLVNAIHPEITFRAALMQAISVAGIGLVFGAIYYRSERTLWPCVIYHAIQDASAFVASGTLYGVTQKDAVGSTGMGQAIYSILFAALFFYLMREQNMEEV